MQDSYLILRAVFPICSALIVWYIWSIKQSFLSKKEFKEFEQKIKEEISKVEQKLQKELTSKQNQIDILKTTAHQQHSTIAEVKTTLKHMSDTLVEIKDYLFSRRRKKD